MADWKKRFSSSYRFMRVSRATGAEVERLRNIRTGGTLEFNQDSSYETGTIDYTGELSIGADLIRVYLDAEFPDGVVSEALGTFLVSAPKRDKVGSVATGSARLSGRLREVAEDEFDGPITVPAGTNVVEYAAGLLRAAGLEVVADPSGYTLSAPWVLGLDDSGGGMAKRLGSVNRLLDVAGFSPARCDGMGRVILSRYVEPKDRAVSLTMEEGWSARFENSVVDERDIDDVANVVHAVYETAEETIIGTAVDADPESPFSTVSRGWRKAVSYSFSDLPDGDTATERQAAANSKAEELLRTQASSIRRVTATHVYAPVSIGDAVDVVWPSAQIEGKFAIRKRTLTLVGGCPMELEVRRYER